MNTGNAKTLERLLRKRGWIVSRDAHAVRVHGRTATGELWALLLAGDIRKPYVGVMDLSVETPGTGIGSALVDDLTVVAARMSLRGLCFTDASDGAKDGAGFWRRYAAKRAGVALEHGTSWPSGVPETRLVRVQVAA